MKTIYTTELTNKQLDKARELVEICKKFDGSDKDPYLSNNLNYYKEMPAFFLGYIDKILVALLAVYEDGEYAEISLYTHPSYRRRGFAKKLYKLFLEKTKNYNFSEIDFVTERIFLDKNPEILNNCKLMEIPGVEYKLSRQRVPYDLKINEEYKISIAKEENITEIANMLVKLFDDTSLEERINYAKTAIKDDDVLLYIISKDDKIIGACNIDISYNSNYFYSLGIAKDCQGHGIGTYFMKSIINDLINKNDKIFELAVDEDNIVAKNLYEKLGFKETTEFVYLTHKK